MITFEDGILLADGFNDALIGTGQRANQPTLAVYDTKKCIEVLRFWKKGTA